MNDAKKKARLKALKKISMKAGCAMTGKSAPGSRKEAETTGADGEDYLGMLLKRRK